MFFVKFDLILFHRLLGSEDDDQEDEINLALPNDDDPDEEEKDEEVRRHMTAEIDVESVLVKSVTHTYDKSSSHCLRVSATTPFSLHK